MAARDQCMFTLSWLVNGASVNKWTRQEINEQLNDTYAAHIGDWQVAWGPVYSHPDGDTNGTVAMYVARGTENNRLVFAVAIAGVNQGSLFDWLIRDQDLRPIVWPYVKEATMSVTAGNNAGLTKLLAMTSTTIDSPTVPVTLQSFLHAIPYKGNTGLWIGGHGLGGSLAAMLTLALMDPNSTLNAQNDVSVRNWGDLLLVATAAPSIGDGAFGKYFFEAIRSTATTGTDIDFTSNSRDVVPHTWYSDSVVVLARPWLRYDLDLDPKSCLVKAIASRGNVASGNHHARFTPARFSSPYPLKPYTTPKGSLYRWNPESKYLAQMAYQHFQAYVEFYKCPWLNSPSLLDDPKAAYELLQVINHSLQRNNIC